MNPSCLARGKASANSYRPSRSGRADEYGARLGSPAIGQSAANDQKHLPVRDPSGPRWPTAGRRNSAASRLLSAKIAVVSRHYQIEKPYPPRSCDHPVTASWSIRIESPNKAARILYWLTSCFSGNTQDSDSSERSFPTHRSLLIDRCSPIPRSREGRKR